MPIRSEVVTNEHSWLTAWRFMTKFESPLKSLRQGRWLSGMMANPEFGHIVPQTTLEMIFKYRIQEAPSNSRVAPQANEQKSPNKTKQNLKNSNIGDQTLLRICRLRLEFLVF